MVLEVIFLGQALQIAPVAYHGDIGVVISEDLFMAISNSGETEEIVELISFLNNIGNHPFF